MINKLKKKGNYKLIIGLIISIIFSVGMVHALYRGRADELSYDPSGTWLHSTNVQDALDELKERKGCPANNICFQKKSTLALGDYVSYTPSKASYTTDTTMTGYTSAQTINPSELNLWRVIAINQDGTVDIISEYVSSTAVYFNGQTGYQNLVGYLNVLASQYETTGITVGSRHFGYNGQTEFITDTQYFVNPAPWTCSTGGTCTPDPDDYESSGGGDTLYMDDYNLVYNVLGTRVAHNVGTLASTNYWMASRYYDYSDATYFIWHGRSVLASGSSSNDSMYCYSSYGFFKNVYSSALRPIVTLSSSLSYNGIGNEVYPMEIVS